ncbi:MAG: hypothetical protein DMG21_18730 [Acidobacteria bacterium]|nr:MAG: hypothetical protein DMG21_18730 [Acidobacteriota bacterium]
MDSLQTLSRRHLLKGLAATAALGYSRAGQCASPADAPAVTSREKLFLFRYSDVRLTGGPLKDQFDRIHASYMGLNEDGLLKEMRVRAGLPAPGEYLGGWYDRDGFAPGHCFGQYISGLARFADATGDRATADKARRLVDGFAAAIGPDGFCYPSKKAATNFPAYNYDKYVVGLLDAYRFAGVVNALEILDRVTRGAIPYMPPRALDRLIEHPQHGADDESYTLGENLFYAYEVTGKKEYFEMAKKYLLTRTYFEPLSRGENVLPGRHAYSHCNALSSAARAYQGLGNPMYLAAIRNAWDMIERTQQFASGGWGPNETFVEPGKGKLGESLDQTHAHFETPCGAYAHLKLARYLLLFTGEARYGDGLERVLYNTVLGAKDPSADGHYFYYSDYHPFATKAYFPDKYPCCSGTLPQGVADYLISAYFQSSDGIYVNLFAPSVLSWKIQGAPAQLIQNTGFPESESTELRLKLSSPAEFTVYVRIPSWLQNPAQILVNDRSTSVAAEPRTFASIRRRWNNGDTIQVTFPFSLRAEAVDDQHPNTVALMHGPLMMVALDRIPTLEKSIISSPQALKKVPNTAGLFELPTAPEKRRFVPFYKIGEESYTTYFQLA